MEVGDPSLDKVRRFFLDSTRSPDEDRLDRRFGQIAVARKYLTTAQLEEGLAEQKKDGERIRLGQILMRRRYLTSEQFVEILRIQGKTLRLCERCDRVYDIGGHPEEVKVRCLKCGEELRELQPGTGVEGTILAHTPYEIAKDIADEGRLRLGRYVLIREVARGGMGVVFEAEDPELRRRVALKILREGEASAEVITRLHREAAIAAQLRHPNIVAIHEVGMLRDAQGQPTHFIAMDFVEGATLAEAFPKTKREELLRMLEEIARAVGYAHARGVVHRDLKPSNVLVEKTGRVLLTDFGLARAVGFDTKLTRTQAVMGTPNYMAPEQVEGRTKEIDARTDVYALGVMLYEILTGRPPYRAQTLPALYRLILTGEPTPPSRLRTTTERDLEVICLKALSREPNRRYAGGNELAADLERFRKEEPIFARPAGFLYRSRRVLRKRRALALGALSIFLGVSLAVLAVREADYRRAKREAKSAFEARDWNRALASARRGLEIHENEELRTILTRAATFLELEESEKQRRIAEGEWYREIREKKLGPLEGAIRETRPWFYHPNIDIREHLRKVERSLEELEKIAADPRAARLGDLWTLLGLGWYFVGDNAKAEKALLVAAEANPEDGRTHFYLAKLLIERSRHVLLYWDQSPGHMRAREEESRHLVDWASAHLARSRQDWAGADEIDLHIASGYQAWAERRAEELPKICEEGFAQFPQAPGLEEYWNLLALTSDGEARVHFLDRAIECRPHYAWAYFFRAITRRALGDASGAIEDLTAAIRINSRYAEAYMIRGGELLQRGDADAALADLNESIRLNPNFGASFTERAMALERKGDTAGSLADLTRALDLDPRSTLALYLRGILRVVHGDPDGAFEDFSRLVEVDADHGGGHYQLGRLLEQKGNSEDALHRYAEAIRCDPNSLDPYLARALLRKSRGETAPACADLDRVLALDPNHFLARVHRGVARGNRGDLQGALEDFNRAVELQPKDAEALTNRGAIRAQRSDLDGALADFAAAIAADPTHVAAYFNRAFALESLGDLPGAAADYRKVLEITPPDWPRRSWVEERLARVSK